MAASQKIDISSGTIIRAVLIVLSFWFVYFIRDVVLMLFSAIIVAAAIEPMANKFEKYKIPRAVTVIGTYIAGLLVLSLAVTVMIPPLVDQTRQLASQLPAIERQLQSWAGVIPPEATQAIVGSLQDVLLNFGNSIANSGFNVFAQTYSLFSGTLTLLFVFVLAFYLVMEEDALKKMFRLMVPKVHLPYVEMIIDKAQKRVGRWVLAQIALALIIGLIVGVGLWILGVKYALALGILAGVMEIIPVIGPILAAIPAVLVAFSQSWVLGLVALGFYLLVQQAENNLLVPRIMKKALGLSPLITLIAVLLGARLAGVVGVILSVPIATILSVIVSSLVGDAGAKK